MFQYAWLRIGSGNRLYVFVFIMVTTCLVDKRCILSLHSKMYYVQDNLQLLKNYFKISPKYKLKNNQPIIKYTTKHQLQNTLKLKFTKNMKAFYIFKTQKALLHPLHFEMKRVLYNLKQ